MFRFFAVLCLAFCPIAASAADTIPAEHFAQLPFLDDPEISPDGKYIAARFAMGGKQYLGIHGLFERASPVVISMGETELKSWDWINNDWLVLRVGAAASVEGSQDWYLQRIVTVNRTGTKLNRPGWNEAAQNAGDVLWIARDGRPELLLAMQTSIYTNLEGFWPKVVRVDATNGRLRQVLKSSQGIFNWYADGDGLVRMGVGYADGGRRARLLYRDRENASFRTIDRADSRKDESLLRPTLFLAEPGKAIALSDKDGFNAAYELDLTTLQLGKQIFAAPGYDIDRIVRNKTGNGYAGVHVTRDRARIEWLDPEFATLQQQIDKAVGPDRTAMIVSRSRDTNSMIVKVGAADQPGAFYWYDPDVGRMSRIGWVNEMLKDRHLSPVRTIRYKARDGLEIPAVLTLPRARPAKALPLVIVPHGGPEARDEESWDWWVQFLADRGYAVIQPNYRGSTGYGAAYLSKGDGQWGLAMQDDLNDAITWLAGEGMVDPKRVCMAGASYGGYAAMRAAQRDGALYRCAISFAGVSDLQGMLNYDRRFLCGSRSADGWRESAPDLKAVSPLYHAADFSAPILILHGKKDLRVPVRQSREMVEKLRAAGKPVEYIEQPEGDHHFSREADRLEFLKAMEAFLAKHNPA
jgi:dipeptidyl aminopeptidase/acylaminoacyl peptidase